MEYTAEKYIFTLQRVKLHISGAYSTINSNALLRLHRIRKEETKNAACNDKKYAVGQNVPGKGLPDCSSCRHAGNVKYGGKPGRYDDDRYAWGDSDCRSRSGKQGLFRIFPACLWYCQRKRDSGSTVLGKRRCEKYPQSAGAGARSGSRRSGLFSGSCNSQP